MFHFTDELLPIFGITFLFLGNEFSLIGRTISMSHRLLVTIHGIAIQPIKMVDRARFEFCCVLKA